MKFARTYLLILIGAIILFTAKTDSFKTPVLYILGIILLMLGLFNVSRSIRSKDELDNENDDL